MRARILILIIGCSFLLVACHREAAVPMHPEVAGTTPLMVAAAKGDSVLVTKLLRGGANVDGADKDGYTALHRASHCGDIQVVKTLIAAGANINARTKENATPLLVSIDMGCGKPEITMALIQAGADVNMAESDGDTAIVIAATETSFDVFSELLKRGANPNAQGMNGETALHYAAMNNVLDRVELLLQFGARADIQNSASRTALEFASPEAKKLLTQAAQVAKQGKQRQYKAPDGGAYAVVVPVSKEAGRSEYESRIEFHSSDGKISCAVEYSSDDSEHGFGVVKAEWTPDSQYFVFSLTSSGGHQAWHAPTQFLSRKDGKVRTLDDYFATGISEADFRLVAPNTIETEVEDGNPVPVSIKLAALPPVRSSRNSKPFLIDCTGGHVFKPDQP